FFFFSSRRRHTRCLSDWSSDVCSSDLDSLPDAARGDAGIELPAVTAAAQGVAAADSLGWEAAFLRAAAHGRPGWGARLAQWREVEAELIDLMDRVTVGDADPARAARATARELDRLLGATR